MKLDVAPRLLLSLSLLAATSACDDGKAPGGGEAKADGDAKGGGEVKAGEVEAGDAKAGDAKGGEVKADATAGEVKAGGEVKAAGDAKAADDVKAGSVAQIVADAKAGADVAAGADAKAPADPTAPAEPTAVVDPTASPKPGVDVASLYWASPVEGGKRSTIDIIDLPDGEALMKLAEAHEYPDGVSATFPAKVKLPRGHAKGDEWVVATTAGDKRGKAVAFGGYGGAGETHFIVVLDVAAEGLAARAGKWTGPVPTLREAKPTSMGKGPGKELFGRIEPAIVAAAEPTAKKALGRKPLAARHLTAVEGRFPNGFTHLITFVRPLAPADDIGAEHVAGLLLADATGRTEILTPAGLSIDRDEFLFLVDLEGDGIDEVVFDSSYYEGSYRLLLTWSATGKLELRSLTGDGA